MQPLTPSDASAAYTAEQIPMNVNEILDELTARNAALTKENILLTARVNGAVGVINNQQSQIEALQHQVAMLEEAPADPEPDVKASPRRPVRGAGKTSEK